MRPENSGFDINDVWIVFPIGKRERHVINLFPILEQYKGRIVFVNNKPNYTKFDSVHHIDATDTEFNIYKWWNIGIDYAIEQGAKWIAVLNDDLMFKPDLIENMIDCAISSNKYICSAVGGGGAAWVINVDYDLRADEQFQWYYGDTDFFRRAQDDDQFCWYQPDPPGSFNQLENQVFTNSEPGVLDIAKLDKRKYYAKWNMELDTEDIIVYTRRF